MVRAQVTTHMTKNTRTKQHVCSRSEQASNSNASRENTSTASKNEHTQSGLFCWRFRSHQSSLLSLRPRGRPEPLDPRCTLFNGVCSCHKCLVSLMGLLVSAHIVCFDCEKCNFRRPRPCTKWHARSVMRWSLQCVGSQQRTWSANWSGGSASARNRPRS